MNIYLDWVDFKEQINIVQKLRYIEKETFYNIYYKDDVCIFETSVLKDSGADQTDFETNFKSLANLNSELPTDSDGSPLQRVKITTTGWSYQLHGVEFKTSQLDSIVSKKSNGVDFGFSTIKCYDSDNIELTTQGECDTVSVKTVLDWEPTHDYEIVGGMLKQQSIPGSNVRLWVVGAPDVSEGYGGGKCFVTNVNLSFIGIEEGVRVDGRAPKYLSYDATYHTNKLRLIFTHNAGLKHPMHMIFEIFKA